VAFDVIFSEPSIYRNADQDDIIDQAVANLNRAQALMEDAQEQSPLPGGQAPRPGQSPAQEQPPLDARQARREAGTLMREAMDSIRGLSGGQDDASFAQAEADFGRVVQTVFFSTQGGNTETWPADLQKPLFTLHDFGTMEENFQVVNDEGVDAKAQFPIPSLRQAAGVIGNVTGKPDAADSVLRRIRLFTLFDGKAVPGLSGASLLAAGEEGDLYYDAKAQEIRWGDYRIPVDEEGKSLLRFKGSLDRYIPYYALDILQSAQAYTAGDTAFMEEAENYLSPENFEGKYVFFGYYAPGLFDIFTTPISSVYPGMGAHITMLDNMLLGDFIRESPRYVGLLIIILTIILVTALVLFIGKIPLLVSGIILVFGMISGLGLGAFQIGGLWLPLAAPLFAAALAFLIATVYNYATEGSQKRFIQGAFSRYLSPEVIKQIIADPSMLNLGGERREMSAIFTDIQRFSSISSELQDQYGEDGPKVLVSLLNLYLTEMSNIVLANQGTIDKYEGDAIIAFFGAPLQVPNHASMACRTALMMKKRELELREQIMKSDSSFYKAMSKLTGNGVIRPERPLYTRVGVNTGDMVVGNMGTPNKMDYTIMGNAVNLAARLEGVNKQYDTHGILISEYTRKHLGDEFLLRPLSRVTVVGIPTPLRLYELLDVKAEAPGSLVEMAALWEDALGRYEGRDFASALKLFRDLLRSDPADGPAKLYAARCEGFMKNPPPAAWDGVDNLTEK